MKDVNLGRLRIFAWLIDLAIVFGIAILLGGFGWFIGACYWLVRDGLFEGQSVGKRIMGLKVIARRNEVKCTFFDSTVRNALWVIPVIQVAVGLTGLHYLMHDRRGRHWGDRLAQTQVVAITGSDTFCEGKSA